MGLKTTFLETLLVNEKKSGRKITAFPVKGRVSEFWHKNCSPSTITLWLAKLKTDSKTKYSIWLNFADIVTKIFHQNKTYYLHYWYIINQLWTPFKTWRNIQVPLLMKELSALMPLYVCSTNLNGLTMCAKLTVMLASPYKPL